MDRVGRKDSTAGHCSGEEDWSSLRFCHGGRWDAWSTIGEVRKRLEGLAEGQKRSLWEASVYERTHVAFFWPLWQLLQNSRASQFEESNGFFLLIQTLFIFHCSQDSQAGSLFGVLEGTKKYLDNEN